MKTKNILMAFFLLAFLVATPSFAQRKKDLKEENESLTAENTKLKNDKKVLEQKKVQLEANVKRLQKDSSMMRMEYDKLNKDYDDVRREKEDLESKVKSSGSTSNPSGGTGTSTGGYSKPVRDPNDKRPCATMESKLADNTTYTQSFNKLQSNGWGVQVYSFADLCLAVERAKEFSQQYKMFNTYIRVKNVNGQRMYAVIYGSIKDEASAKVYCENFKKIAKDEEAKKAFVIKH